MTVPEMRLPENVNILGVDYKIEYVDKPSDVDIYKQTSLWGQIDFWTRTIRIYKNERPLEDIWGTILHEIIHGISEALHLKNVDDENDTADLLGMALADLLIRNKWLR